MGYPAENRIVCLACHERKLHGTDGKAVTAITLQPWFVKVIIPSNGLALSNPLSFKIHSQGGVPRSQPANAAPNFTQTSLPDRAR